MTYINIYILKFQYLHLGLICCSHVEYCRFIITNMDLWLFNNCHTQYLVHDVYFSNRALYWIAISMEQWWDVEWYKNCILYLWSCRFQYHLPSSIVHLWCEICVLSLLDLPWGLWLPYVDYRAHWHTLIIYIFYFVWFLVWFFTFWLAPSYDQGFNSMFIFIVW